MTVASGTACRLLPSVRAIGAGALFPAAAAVTSAAEVRRVPGGRG
jgi:hypothetical protein